MDVGERAVRDTNEGLERPVERSEEEFRSRVEGRCCRDASNLDLAGSPNKV